MKIHHYSGRFVNRYFWRIKQRQQIDCIKEYDGIMPACKFIWNPNKNRRFAKTFTNAYPNNKTKIIQNFYLLNSGVKI